MLTPKVLKYFSQEYDFNCAESMVYAANDEYKRKMPKESFLSAAAFGLGMGVESTCGAVTGSLIVIGTMFTKTRAHEDIIVKKISKEFIYLFHKKMGTLECKKLKEKYQTNKDGCLPIMICASHALEETLEKYIIE